MRQWALIAISWIALLSAMIAMIIGHSGNHALNWRTNHISTYAATAPHGRWITAAMLLSGFSLACVGVLVSREKILGSRLAARMIPLFFAATISGLCMLAWFQESTKAGAAGIGEQSLHDTGLAVFFHGAILTALVLGVLLMFQKAGWKQRILGGTVSLLALAAFPVMTMPWPRLIGQVGTLPGLMQRASLFSIWLAFVLVLAVVSSLSGKRD